MRDTKIGNIFYRSESPGPSPFAVFITPTRLSVSRRGELRPEPMELFDAQTEILRWLESLGHEVDY